MRPPMPAFGVSPEGAGHAERSRFNQLEYELDSTSGSTIPVSVSLPQCAECDWRR